MSDILPVTEPSHKGSGDYLCSWNAIILLKAMWEANNMAQKPDKLWHLQIASKMTILSDQQLAMLQRSKKFVV